MRQAVADLIRSVQPFDALERTHIADASDPFQGRIQYG